MSHDVVAKAKAALDTGRARESRFWPRALVTELVAEVESLRWSLAHSGDHMCDECWPPDKDETEEGK